jgi:hypothetical protein
MNNKSYWEQLKTTVEIRYSKVLGVLFTRDFWLLLQKYGGYTTHSFRNLNNSFLNIHSPYTASTKVDAQTFWNITLTPLVRRLPLSEQQLDIKKWREILVGSFVTLLTKLPGWTNNYYLSLIALVTKQLLLVIYSPGEQNTQCEQTITICHV